MHLPIVRIESEGLVDTTKHCTLIVKSEKREKKEQRTYSVLRGILQTIIQVS